MSRYITFEFFGGVAKILVGEEVAEGKFLLAPLDFAVYEAVLTIILSPIVGEMTFLLGHIDESKSPFVVVERFYPDVEAVKIHKPETLDAEFVLVDGDYFLVSNEQTCRLVHLADVVAKHQWRGEHTPHHEMSAVFSRGKSVANFKHIEVVPMSGAAVLADVLVHIDDGPQSKLGPRAKRHFAVPAMSDVARNAPHVSHVCAPKPRLVVAPLADIENHRATGGVDSVAHQGVGGGGVLLIIETAIARASVAPVEFQKIDAPLSVLPCIVVLITTSAGVAAASLGAGAVVDAEFKTLGVYVIRHSLDAVRKLLLVGNKEQGLWVALHLHPSVIDDNVLVASVFETEFDEEVGGLLVYARNF